MDELYAASQSGASMDIIARTTCALRPGVEGLSENIRVRSLVGRFLEHSRIYSFEAGGETKTYIGSPDLMSRNLDHRIEVLVPVENTRMRQDVHAILDSALADDVNAWLLEPDGTLDAREPGDEAAHPPRDDDAPRAGEGAQAGRASGVSVLTCRPRRDTSEPVDVAIVDIGSNTARLLVASVDRAGDSRAAPSRAPLPPARGRRPRAGPDRPGEARGDGEGRPSATRASRGRSGSSAWRRS